MQNHTSTFCLVFCRLQLTRNLNISLFFRFKLTREIRGFIQNSWTQIRSEIWSDSSWPELDLLCRTVKQKKCVVLLLQPAGEAELLVCHISYQTAQPGGHETNCTPADMLLSDGGTTDFLLIAVWKMFTSLFAHISWMFWSTVLLRCGYSAVRKRAPCTWILLGAMDVSV